MAIRNHIDVRLVDAAWRDENLNRNILRPAMRSEKIQGWNEARSAPAHFGRTGSYSIGDCEELANSAPHGDPSRRDFPKCFKRRILAGRIDPNEIRLQGQARAMELSRRLATELRKRWFGQYESGSSVFNISRARTYDGSWRNLAPSRSRCGPLT